MIQYIIRRLLIMIPTLLGISLLTLLLVHLAPGDPVQLQLEGAMGKGTISPEEIEAMRRTYYLHLPVFLNFSPEDASTINETIVEELSSEDENIRERAVRKLEVRGGVSLEPAVALLDSASPEVKESILSGLQPVAARMGISKELEAAADKSAFWKDFIAKWPEHPEEEAERLVALWLAETAKGDSNAGVGDDKADSTTADSAHMNASSAGSKKGISDLMGTDTAPISPAVSAFDTLALPALLDALAAQDPQSPSLRPLTLELSGITGVTLPIRENDDLELRARIIEDWARWWAPKRADYVTFSGPARVAAVFTETQYAKWLKRLVTLDFDRSIRDNIPIRRKLGERLKVTLTLAMLSLVIAYLVAIPLGVFSAVKQYSISDRVSTVVLFMLYSLPSFWVAMLLQQYLCGVDVSSFDWFPLVGLISPGFDSMSPGEKMSDLTWHLILPVGVLTYRSFASLSRFQRVGMLEVIRQDFIRTARAKGLSERAVILKHGLRNSVLPIITLIGMQLPFLVGGAVIVEAIFQINGMGLETLEAIRTRDMNWIMASVSLTAVMTMVGILLSDILYAVVDPRISVGEDGA